MSLKGDFLNHQAQTTKNPFGLDIVKAEGSYIYDRDGKSYLDMIAGVAVSNIGHRHPKIIKAIQDQIDNYLHVMVYGEYIQEPQVRLAKKLASLLPEKLNCSYFVNSGTEANEAAIKLAKRFTGRTEIIAMKKSYHGSTHGSLSITGNEEKKYFVRPLLPDVKFIEFNNLADLNQITRRTACVITEPIQGDAGIRIPDNSYMEALRLKCNETGTLLIFDEIQTGYGRTGSMFTFEQFNIIPDILTIGKAMAGGMAMGGFISSKEIMHTLSNNPMLGHITTFGGHPVCCAAGVAMLEVLEKENIIESVNQKADLLATLLRHKIVKEIRFRGLFFAVELENFEVVEKVVNKCLANGLIGFWFISCKNAFRIAPPLNISENDIRKAGSIIQQIFDEVAKER